MITYNTIWLPLRANIEVCIQLSHNLYCKYRLIWRSNRKYGYYLVSCTRRVINFSKLVSLAWAFLIYIHSVYCHHPMIDNWYTLHYSQNLFARYISMLAQFYPVWIIQRYEWIYQWNFYYVTWISISSWCFRDTHRTDIPAYFFPSFMTFIFLFFIFFIIIILLQLSASTAYQSHCDNIDQIRKRDRDTFGRLRMWSWVRFQVFQSMFFFSLFSQSN